METKLSKVNGVCKTKEPLKKDLIIQLTNLQENYDNLENKFKDLEKENETLHIKNNENIEKINCMQRRIDNFGKDDATISKQTQTDRGIELKCTECNFEALTNTELSWHMGEVHGWSDDQKNDEIDMDAGPRYCGKCDFEAADGYELDGHIWAEHDDDDTDDESISCPYCDESFSEMKDFMVHKKVNHVEKVSLCWNFTDGSCIYGEESCWFIHNKQEQKSITCKICEETFISISKFMKHKKSEHIENVKLCMKDKEGQCPYLENCWFVHGQNEHLNKKENVSHDKTIQNLMDIVEKFTKKVVAVEEIVLKKL